MHRKTKTSCLLILLSLTISLTAAEAMPTITCHCFRDRTYDPARPAVADPYFLATTQNSFFAAVFGIEKNAIVMKKQTGTAMEDLWIAYWVAKGTGMSPESLLDERQKKAGWNDIVTRLHIPTQAIGGNFIRGLRAGASDSRLAESVVDELFARYRLIKPKELGLLRKRGATNQELIITTMIAAKTGQSAERLLDDVMGKRKSWGNLLNDAKIDPANIKEEIATLLRIPRH